MKTATYLLPLLLSLQGVFVVVHGFVLGTCSRGLVAGNRDVCSRSSGSSTSNTALMMGGPRKSSRKMLKGDLNKKAMGEMKSGGGGGQATWMQVLGDADKLEKEDGSVKVVSGKYGPDELFFILARYNNTIYAISESCGRCKFPMMSGKIEPLQKGNEGSEGGDLGITCPLCGLKFEMNSGKFIDDGEKLPFLKSLVAGVMAQKPAADIKAYPVRISQENAVQVRIE